MRPSPSTSALVLGGGIGGGNNLGGSNSNMTNAGGLNVDAVWTDFASRVLPLFNGQGLKCPMEDANDMLRYVRQRILYYGLSSEESYFELFPRPSCLTKPPSSCRRGCVANWPRLL